MLLTVTLKRLVVTIGLLLAVVVRSQDVLFGSVDTLVPLYPAGVPSDFASFSLEVKCAMEMFANTDASPRTSYVNMVSWLASTATGGSAQRGPNIRIGGNSADESLFIPNTSQPLPPGYTYRITQADLESYKVVAKWNGTVTIGTDMKPATPQYAAAHAMAVAATLDPSVLAGYEIGNENDLFFENGIRPATYNYTDYDAQFEQYGNMIGNVVNRSKRWCQGATWASGRWYSDGDEYITKYTKFGWLDTFSLHHYAQTVCHNHTFTIDDLLTEKSASSVVALAQFVSAAVRSNIVALVGEGNSASCGGKEGISNTYTSTLWAMDSMLYAASSGLTRWNFHGCPGGAYTPIALDPQSGNAIARPLFYAMLSFAFANQFNSMVVQAKVWNTTNQQIRLWATHTLNYGNASCARVCAVVIHKDYKAKGNATVHLKLEQDEFRGKEGTITRTQVTGNIVDATQGVHFAGYTFDGSTDGLPGGSHITEKVQVSSSGWVEFSLEPTQIVMVEVFSGC